LVANDFAGKKLVLYFYPKDMTEGCTIEARDFTSMKKEYASKGYTIIGVSRDSVESHRKFAETELTDELILRGALLPDADSTLNCATWTIKRDVWERTANPQAASLGLRMLRSA
jgi:peroxiredoxin Q/BCP